MKRQCKHPKMIGRRLDRKEVIRCPDCQLVFRDNGVPLDTFVLDPVEFDGHVGYGASE